MKILVAYSDRSGAGEKAAREVAFRLEADIIALEPESWLAKMSWMSLFEMEDPIPRGEGFELLVLCLEITGQRSSPESKDMLFRFRSRGGELALVLVTSKNAGDLGAVIMQVEQAAGRRPRWYLEATPKQVCARDLRHIWGSKLDRFVKSIEKMRG